MPTPHVTVEELATWPLYKLEEYVGGLSAPSKMPCQSWNIPAQECKTGSKLRALDAGKKPADRVYVCGECYAMEGRVAMPKSVAAGYRRLDAFEKPLWVEAMAELINRRKQKYHRWFDAGDLQSVKMLGRICEVCRLTPDTLHWLPTREYRTIADYVSAGGTIPDNLNIRPSAHMIGGKLPTFPRLRSAGIVSISSVSRSDDTYPDAHVCPSRHQGGKCGDCRACWDRTVPHVTYPLH